MNIKTMIAVFCAILMTIPFCMIVSAGATIGAHTSVATPATNTVDGTYTLFSQDYSTMSGLPDNIFMASAVSPYTFNNTAYYNHTSSAAALSAVYYGVGELYVSGLAPVVNSTYEFNLTFDRPSFNCKVNVFAGGAWVDLQREANGSIHIHSYYNDGTHLISTNEFFLPSTTGGWIDLRITRNGWNNLVTVWSGATSHSVTNKFYTRTTNSNNLTYSTISNAYVKFGAYTATYTWLEISVNQITQTCDKREYLTAIAPNNITTLGLDGPHVYSEVDGAIAELTSHGFTATIWEGGATTADWANATVIGIYKDLIDNHSWELGIHFAKTLNTRTWADVVTITTNEMANVTTKFGRVPTSWSCLGNADNATIGNYLYALYGMRMRNQFTEANVINLMQTAMPWYNQTFGSQMSLPAFTHETDVIPAAAYSIRPDDFARWVNDKVNSSMEIRPYDEWYEECHNSQDASFTDLSVDTYSLDFTANTNGYDAYVHAVQAGDSLKALIDTSDDSVVATYSVENPDIWVEDGVSYSLRDAILLTSSSGVFTGTVASYDPEGVINWTIDSGTDVTDWSIPNLNPHDAYQVSIDGIATDNYQEVDTAGFLNMTYDGTWAAGHTFDVVKITSNSDLFTIMVSIVMFGAIISMVGVIASKKN